MKKFVKGKLETVVEDNDRRIPEYKANGWKEVPLNTPTNDKQGATDKAIDDVANSEKAKGNSKGKNGKGKANKPDETDQKVNDAIDANSNAATESEAVDDGLETNGSNEPDETKGGD